jgi:hypothetical protein
MITRAGSKERIKVSISSRETPGTFVPESPAPARTLASISVASWVFWENISLRVTPEK